MQSKNNNNNNTSGSEREAPPGDGQNPAMTVEESEPAKDSPRKRANRHLTFAKQDSQSSIIEIHKYEQFRDATHEPHVQSSGSIILKEPSLASLRNRSQLRQHENLPSGNYLHRQEGGHY